MATAKKKGFHKSIKIYFSMLKKMPTTLGQLSSTSTSSSSRLFSACKYPKTPSFAVNRTAAATSTSSAATTATAAAAAATLSDVDRFLQENFQSLYPPPPATSGSLQEDTGDDSSSPEPSSPTSSCGDVAAAAVAGGGVAVMTFSKDPYEDFRRSMEDMMEVRHVDKLGPLDWDFMEELLLCYLELNEQCVHKYILRAFTDLTVSFRRREGEERPRPPVRRRKSVRTEAVAVAGRRFPAGR